MFVFYIEHPLLLFTLLLFNSCANSVGNIIRQEQEINKGIAFLNSTYYKKDQFY